MTSESQPSNKNFSILIADRNPHVRRLLERELKADGYQVRVADNGRDVLEWAYRLQPLDLIILDLDLPDIDEQMLFGDLQDRIPVLPIIIHSFQPDGMKLSVNYRHAVFVEKGENSIEKLKKAVGGILDYRR
ncbi:MAG: response regulator [Deltaproteobacteria bacterium]|jgi:DNA-binding NtrC family response regulator